LRSLPSGSVVSVGNFDGLHLGHARLLQVAAQIHRDTKAAALAVVTFEPHPLTVLRPELAPPRLTPPQLKHRLLAAAGVDCLVELPPARQVLDLSAEDFWTILSRDVRAAALVEGEDFNFGKGRGGNIDKLRQWARRDGIALHVVPPVTAVLLDMRVVTVSSSLIRWLIAYGRVREAAICLGRPYALLGRIVQGHQRGRTIGMPTANFDCGDQLAPPDGVYAGRCRVDGVDYTAAVSIGVMPTFGHHHHRQIEAHLIGFSGNLYGRTLELELLDWLREQRKFAGVAQLTEQMTRDLDETRWRGRRDAARAVATM